LKRTKEGRAKKLRWASEGEDEASTREEDDGSKREKGDVVVVIEGEGSDQVQSR
jgi:hypothetical protein